MAAEDMVASSDVTSQAMSQQYSRLFTIPPEMRNRIYESLFKIDTPDGKLTISYAWKYGAVRERSVLELLRTCKLVKAEAERLFYCLNLLRVRSSDAGFDVLRSMGRNLSTTRLQAINSLVVGSQHLPDIDRLVQNLQPLTGLRTLYIEVSRSSLTSDDGRIVKIWPDDMRQLVTQLGWVEEVHFCPQDCLLGLPTKHLLTLEKYGQKLRAGLGRDPENMVRLMDAERLLQAERKDWKSRLST